MSDAVGGLALVVSIKVDADLSGVDKRAYIDALNKRLEWAVGDGLLTGDSEVEVESWEIAVEALEEQEKRITEEDVEEWFRGLIESGSMRLEELPKLLARYALAGEVASRAELAERMGLV